MYEEYTVDEEYTVGGSTGVVYSEVKHEKFNWKLRS